MDSTSTARPRSSSEIEQRDSQRSDGHNSANTSMVRPSMEQLYRPISVPLTQVERRLHQELQSPYEALVPLLRHGTQLGGKRLRPAMLLLAAEATGTVTDDHVVLATVIEMVHTATLIHDDVLDDADTRRHVPTVNARWNDHTSILLGDYLFAQSFRLAATLPSTDACRQIGEASRLVCEGELRQVLQRDALDLDEETYFAIIRSKTAELCRAACALGSQYAGADPEMVRQMSDYGDAVGVAFQIADDFLDLWGDHDSVGKTLGTDIEQGKMTLPLIRLLAESDSRDRDAILDVLRGPSEQRVSRILPFLDDSDARRYTLEKAESYRDTAIASLASLADSPAKRSLRAIADFSVDRHF